MRVLHAADIHAYYDNYGVTDPGTGLNSRYLDLQKTLGFIADTAREWDVNLALVAGDLFKNKRPGHLEVILIAEWLREMADICPVIVIPGNHDVRNDQEPGSLDLLDAFQIPGVIIVTSPQIVGRPDVHIPVACLPAVSKSALLSKDEYRDLDPVALNQVLSDKLVDVLRGLAVGLPCGGPCILLTHYTVAGARTSSEQVISVLQEPVLPLAEVASGVWSLVCLGHIHKAQVMSQDPWVGYSGSVERVNFGEEDEPKGFYIHDIARGVHDFIEVPARAFTTLNIPEDRVEDLIGSLLIDPHKDLTGQVVRLRVKCTAAQARQVNVPAVKAALLARGASMVADVAFEITDDARETAKSHDVTGAMDPLTALARYIDARPEILTKRDALLARAASLRKEVA